MTPSRKKVFIMIAEFIMNNGYAPTHMEIMEGVGNKSKSSPSLHIDILANDGYLKKIAGRDRGIEITEKGADYYRKYR